MESLRGPMQKFAMSLYQACRKEQPHGNLLYSPMTASAGLLLILLGSDGKTRAEIEHALKLDDSPLFTHSHFEDDLQMAFRHALAVIHKTTSSEREAEDYGAFRAYRINKIFVDAGIPLREDFVARIEKLRAEISFIDFTKSTTAARQQMNDQVEEKMNGRVTECFAQGAIDKQTQMVLANGICFRARFATIFDPARTTTEPFYTLDGKSVNVHMMHAVQNLAFAQDPETGMIYLEIPYALNSASLLIFLPLKRDGLSATSKSLTPAIINKINLAKRKKEVHISLPRFSMQTQLDLRRLLLKMGVKSLFNEYADLSRMSDEPLMLSSAVHNGYFSVDELGTDAGNTTQHGGRAPVTSGAPNSFVEANGAGIKRQASMEAKSSIVTVNVDHPFMFAVRHNKSGIMVCLGRVETLQPGATTH